MKISEKLEMIRRLVPKGPTEFGQLYAAKEDTQRTYERITLHTIFKSDENTHMIRPHVFVAKKARTAEEWHVWLSTHVDEIQRGPVLSGLNARTGKQYFIFKIIGWVGHARKFSKSAAVGRKWRPAKQKRL